MAGSKGSSKLTEAERLDVRSEIAAAAGVSVGNVTKVKQVMTTACTELQEALRNGEISIHRAWLWCEMSPEDQRRALMLHRGERGVKKTIRRLILKHTSKSPAGLGVTVELVGLARSFSQLQASQLNSIAVAAVDVPGKAVFVTEELLQTLRRHRRSCQCHALQRATKADSDRHAGLLGSSSEPGLPSAKTSIE